MAGKHREPVTEKQLQGFKYLQTLDPLLQRLRTLGTQRDRAGNRQLFCDQYVALLLLYFFSPVVTSLRGLRQASTLDKVQKLLGVKRTALGSLSEASSVFDAAPLRDLVRELAAQALPLEHGSLA